MSQPFGSWPAIPGTDALRPLRTSLPWGKPLITIDGWDPMLQIVTPNRITGDNVTGSNNWVASFVGYGSDTSLGPAVAFSTSRSRNSQSPTLVSNGDNLGALRFYGADGYTYLQAATFLAEVDGTPSSNSMPGRLTFFTNTSGTPNLTERLRIDSSGRVLIGYTGATASGVLQVLQADGSGWAGLFSNDPTDGTPGVLLGVRSGLPAIGSSGNQTLLYQPDGGNNIFGGGTTSQSFGNESNPILQVQGTTEARAEIGTGLWSADANPSRLALVKSRNASVGSFTTVSSGDSLGSVVFRGADTSAFRDGSAITGIADALFSSGSSPGRLAFFTTTSGSTTFTERMRIDSGGRVLFGGLGGVTSQGFQEETNLTLAPFVQLLSTTGDTNVAIGRYSATATPGRLIFGKSRGATVGTYTALSSADQIGAIFFDGCDGVSGAFAPSASITGLADAVHTSANVPGRLAFATTTSGAVTPTERLRIDSKGYSTFNIGAAQPGAIFGNSSAVAIGHDTSLITGASIMGFGNNASPATLMLTKTRNTSASTHTTLSSSDSVGVIYFGGSDGTVYRAAGQIEVDAELNFSSNSSPGRMTFSTTTSGSVTPTERMRIDRTGAVFFPSVGTTASAANGFLNSASSPANSLLRSTSSIRYKKDLSEIERSRIFAAAAIRPVEFSSTAPADSGDDTRFVGYIAEDVARIDPALVFRDDEGRPDGVMYDRVLLLQVEALRRRVEELERKQTRH